MKRHRSSCRLRAEAAGCRIRRGADDSAAPPARIVCGFPCARCRGRDAGALRATHSRTRHSTERHASPRDAEHPAAHRRHGASHPNLST
ncbi:hypothetical protein SRHO_G00141120 [Serrasalmus rhombeus]